MKDDDQSHLETLPDGTRVELRGISKNDVEFERAFIEGLSPESRRFRFLASISANDEALLAKLTNIDSAHEVALIALTDEAEAKRQVGAARFSTAADGKAEIAVTVSDGWGRRGLGTLLMQRLIDAARQRGIHMLYSIDSAENYEMKDLAKSLGFECAPDPGDSTQVIHRLSLC